MSILYFLFIGVLHYYRNNFNQNSRYDSDLLDLLFVEFYIDFDIFTLYVIPFGNGYDYGSSLGLLVGYFNLFRKNRKIKDILTL